MKEAIEFVPDSFVEPRQLIKKQKGNTLLTDALLVTLQLVQRDLKAHVQSNTQSYT